MSNPGTSDASSSSSSSSGEHVDDLVQAPTIVEQLQIMHGLAKKKVYGARPVREPFIGDERVTDEDNSRRRSLSLLAPPVLPPSISTLPSIPGGRAASQSVLDRTARANHRRKSPTLNTRPSSHRSQSSQDTSDLSTSDYPPLVPSQPPRNRPVRSSAAVSERRRSKASRSNEAANAGASTSSTVRRTNPYPSVPPLIPISAPPTPFLMSPTSSIDQHHLNYPYPSLPSPVNYTLSSTSPVLMSPVTDASSPSSSQASPLLPDNEPSFISTYGPRPQPILFAPRVAPVEPLVMTHSAVRPSQVSTPVVANTYPSYLSSQIYGAEGGTSMPSQSSGPARTSSTSSLSGWAG